MESCIDEIPTKKKAKNKLQYERTKEKIKKKSELQEIIVKDIRRIRLYQHSKKDRSCSKEKTKYPGLILDNEMTGWSVCLECSAPVKCFKTHNCKIVLDIFKNTEIEKLNDFKTRMSLSFRSNVKQIDVDKVKCTHCDAALQSTQEVKNHLKSIHNIGYFMCKYCGKTIELEKTLKEHEFRAHGNTEYGSKSCEFCGLAFVHSHRLKKHVFNAHQNERPFVCDICSKGFKHNGPLQAHRLIHTGEKNFLCTSEGCGKAFTKETTLTQHERLHTGIKPYKCQACNVAFAQKNSLNVHNNTHHKNK